MAAYDEAFRVTAHDAYYEIQAQMERRLPMAPSDDPWRPIRVGAGERDAGLASGLFNTTQQIGMALGVAVLSTLAASRTETLLAGGHGRAEALTGGYHLAFTVGTGLLVAAFLVALLVLARPGRATAATTA